MAHVTGRLSLFVFCVALLPAAIGCGVSRYNLRFVPEREELKSKPSIQVYVYFAPEHDLDLCAKLKSKELFGRSEHYEDRLNQRMLQSTVVSAEGPVRVIGEDLPDSVAKVFVWGNFAEKAEESADKLAIEQRSKVGFMGNKYGEYWKNYQEMARDLTPPEAKSQIFEIAGRIAREAMS